MRRFSIPRALLAAAYALNFAAGVVSIVNGELSIFKAVLLAAVVITLFALYGKLGRWAQVVGLILGTIYIIIGIGSIGLGVLDPASEIPMLILGTLLFALGVSTVLAIRSDMQAR